MTKTEVYLGLVGTVVSATLDYGLVAVNSSGPTRTKDAPADSAAASTQQVALKDSGQGPVASRASAPGGTSGDVSSAPDGKSMLDSDGMIPDQALLRLSGMVNLANSESEAPDKEAWQQAVTIANQVMDAGRADCSQHYWLATYIKMGKAVISGDGEEYKNCAHLLASSPRNMNQAQAYARKDPFWATR